MDDPPCAFVPALSPRFGSLHAELGSYQLAALLGRGGVGEVWRASYRFLERPAAVKRIRPDVLAGKAAGDVQTLLLHFEREVQTASMLTSPQTVRGECRRMRTVSTLPTPSRFAATL